MRLLYLRGVREGTVLFFLEKVYFWNTLLVVGSDKVTKETREKLFKKRKETTTAEEASGDDFYVIESVIEKKEENGKKLFQIKWAGFSSDENTWEGEGSVPGFIQKFYEDDNNLGKPLPKPMIKH